MDVQHKGLTQAFMSNWRGGVCCKVLPNGVFILGDVVKLAENHAV